MRTVFLSFFFFFVVDTTVAEGLKPNPIEIGAQVSLFRDEGRGLTIEEVQQQRFEKVNSHEVNLGFTNDACWLKVEVANTSSEAQQFYLNAGKLLVDTIQLFPGNLVSGNWRQQV